MSKNFGFTNSRAAVFGAMLLASTMVSAQTFNATGVGPIADPAAAPNCDNLTAAPLNMPIAVTGITAALTDLSVSLSVTHTWRADLVVTLIAPGGSPSFLLFGNVGSTTAGGCGNGNDLAGAYVWVDPAVAGSTNFWSNTANPSTPGTYFTVPRGTAGVTSPPAGTAFRAAFTSLTSAQINGSWTLRVQDTGVGDTGAVSAASLTLVAGGGGGNTAPVLAYTPTTAAGVTFPAGAAGAATSTIAIAATGAAGTGATVVSGCAVSGAGAGSFGAPTTTPANGTFNTATTTGSINLSCTRGAAAATASLACTETSTPGVAATRTWALTCPAATAGGAVVTAGTASGTPSPLPTYNLPTGSSSRAFSFTSTGAPATVTCGITGAVGFVVAPIPLSLAAGQTSNVTVTYTGSTAGTFTGVLDCTTSGTGGPFTYPISVVVGPAAVAAPLTPVPTLSLVASLMLLGGFLGLGMFMANRRA